MKVLVTGASGAFGAHCAKALLADGHQVISIEHDGGPFTTAHLLGIYDQITWAKGSITNANFVKRVVADYGPDAIIHFAALPLVQVATRTTQPIFETNFLGTVNLLEAVKENQWAGKEIAFVYISTDKVYGDAGRRPYTEDMPLNGLAIYDASKACADLVCRTYANCGFANKLAVVRPCNIVATGDLNLNRVLPRLILPTIRREAAKLYRTDYLREFINVSDAVTGIRSVMNALIKGSIPTGSAYNLGSGEQLSLDDIIDAVDNSFDAVNSARSGNPIEYTLNLEWVAAPPISRIEIPFQKLDSSRMWEVFGWTPDFKFVDTVHHLIKWWLDNWGKVPVAVRSRRVSDWHG